VVPRTPWCCAEAGVMAKRADNARDSTFIVEVAWIGCRSWMLLGTPT
jgi:hypothetical protein